MLVKVGEDGIAESVLLERLRGATRDGTADRLKAPPLCVRQIEAAIILIRPYERLYQAVPFLFDSARAAATDEPEARLDPLAATAPCVAAIQGLRSAAGDLHTAMENAATIHPEMANDCRAAFAAVVGLLKRMFGVSSAAVALRQNYPELPRLRGRVSGAPATFDFSAFDLKPLHGDKFV